MNRIFLLLFILYFTNTCQAQGLAWGEPLYGGAILRSLAVDGPGNSYVTGYFSSTTDFDPGPATYTMVPVASQDIFICKYNTHGTLIWARQIGDLMDQYGNSIAYDAAGNVFVTGVFQMTVDFDPGPGTFTMSAGIGSNPNAFVLKLDSTGTFQWAKKFASGSLITGNGISIDATGNVLTTGHFVNTADFDPGSATYTLAPLFLSTAAYISKLSTSGSFIWAKCIKTTIDCSGEKITTDGSDNVYITGIYDGNGDFDPGPGIATHTTSGIGDIFVMELNSSGNYVWSKSMGGPGTDMPTAIALDSSDNVLTSGTFSANADFDPGNSTFLLTSNGDFDQYVSKLDNSGNFLWAVSFGGPLIDQSLDLVCDNSGGVYTTGNFQGLVDFDPGPGTYTINAIGQDGYIHKLDASGNFVWLDYFSGAFGSVLRLDAVNNIYLGGPYGGGDLDPGPATFTLPPVNVPHVEFLLKLNNCTLPTVTIQSLPSYSLCEGYTVNLMASGTGTISWYELPSITPIGNGINYTTSPLAVGIHTYQAKLKDLCGESPFSAPLTITVTPLPQISVSGSTFICIGSTTTLTASGALSYTWGNSQTNSFVIVSPSVQTTYTLCGSGANGCINTSSITVKPNSCTELNDLTNNFDFTVFPNPFYSTITIKASRYIDKVVIYDFLGKKILEQAILDDDSIQTNHLKQGVYLIEISAKGTKKVLRIYKTE